MKYLLFVLIAFGLSFQTPVCWGQQSESFGKYEIHYNVLNADMIPAPVAQGYGIKRSSSRAIVNITVMDTSQGDFGKPVHAQVTTSTINLTGQRREVGMREIADSDNAIYYIGELPIHNLETYDFTITVMVEGEPKPFVLKFRQQFFTE